MDSLGLGTLTGKYGSRREQIWENVELLDTVLSSEQQQRLDAVGAPL